MSVDFEKLITDGFSFELASIKGAGLFASYGDGYGEGAVIGNPDGLLSWKIKVSALPDSDDYLLNAGEFGLQTRFQYLWDFYARHNVAQWHKVFQFHDPLSKKDFLADIAEEQLDYQLFCLTVATVGLTIRQRRVHGVESPGDVVEVENNQEI
ncbi:MAG TPA: hypothetical protein VHU19_14230 [Pyrinomonadaceae bacterium]|jgi:hypothetical protein|nr:hypothetical protein [Pyrinomonadaceae bacterium]